MVLNATFHIGFDGVSNVADIFVCSVKSRQSLCESWEVGQVFNPNIIQFATQNSQYVDVQTKYHAQMPCQTPCHAQMSCAIKNAIWP